MKRFSQQARGNLPRNLFLLVHDYEDLFWLTDRILMERQEMTTIEDDELDRSFVAAMIGMLFEVHELFERPTRKTSVAYRHINETQFDHLPSIANLQLAVLDNMIDCQMRQQLIYDTELKKQRIDREAPCYANGVTCTQWQTHMGYPEAKREASWERCNRLLKRLTSEALEAFASKCVADRMSLSAWAAVSGVRNEG